jgi:predicted nucleic acid-binding protein
LKILIDTNVVLDLLMRRHPFGPAAAKVFQLASWGGVEAYLSAHAITTIDYILRKAMAREQRRATLTRLLNRVSVAPVDRAVVQSALVSELGDFEDAVTHAAAVAVNAEFIVTRNTNDFANSTIPALVPELFLAQIAVL